ncbi:hypothetical protein A6V39_00165 [Candidatus Mycoplasma haematobovis]|uniref:Uncharacterized protein n=1 Tax=Candidatus Mycoplasma haematobovis TaxID=432608 RepID=A0A1A9QDC5_9MOLU|nr:hypothetical protein [Candidatus Mycoplasma haematobovis]OAL10463.1 hypothetical protein A6V39_00165 [Candidatus Mycoplasma haematobovis]
MANKLILFSILGVWTLSGIGVGSYFLWKPELPKDILELLKKENLTPLDTEGTTHDEIWKELIKKHVTSSSSVDATRKIRNIYFSRTASTQTSAEDIKVLKNKCKGLFNQKVTNDTKFNTNKQNAIDWCTTQSKFAQNTQE